MFCICWTHLQIFSVSTVLAEKTSDVHQSWRASAKLSGRRLPPHWTGRGQLIAGVMFGELSVSLFVTLGVCMGGSVYVEIVRKGVIAGLMLQYLLSTFTNVFYYNCPKRQGLPIGAGAKLPESRPPSHWTGRGPLNEGIMFGGLSILLVCFFFRFLIFSLL